MHYNNIKLVIGAVVVFCYFIFGSFVYAQTILTPEEQTKLQQLIADPALQQQFTQNPTALLQTLLSNPDTRDLIIKLLFPNTPVPTSSTQQINSLLNPLPDLLKQFPELNQYLQFLPSSGNVLPTPEEIQQLLNQSLASNTIELHFITPTPLPNETVRVIATLPTQDFRTTEFSWSQDGKVVSSGIGQTEFQFITKRNVGDTTRIVVNARLSNGTTLSKSQIFRTADALITIASGSLTPPHYKGFNLPTIGSKINLSALALVPANSGALSYRWFVDRSLLPTNGANKAVFEANAPLGGSHEVRLEVQNQTKTVHIIKTISIPVARPEVFLYRDPVSLVPIEDQSVVAGQKVRFTALPYFFNSTIKDLSFRWQFLNNEIVGSGDAPNSIEAVAPAQNFLNAFRSSLRVVVENPRAIFEQAQISLPLAIQ